MTLSDYSPFIIPLLLVGFTMSFHNQLILTGQILNYGAFILVLGIVAYRISNRSYTLGDMVQAFYHHIVALFAMVLTMLVVVGAVVFFDLVMCWYKLPEVVGPLYVLPILVVGIAVHSYFADKNKVFFSHFYELFLNFLTASGPT